MPPVDPTHSLGDHSPRRTTTAFAYPTVPGYEMLQPLGEGGMGVVFKARHLALNRLVALKMLNRDQVDEAHLHRFRNEAQSLARLHHPNIVQVYEVGEHEGRPYLSLEYVEGGTLADRLRRDPLDPREAAGIVRVLAEAVEAAHREKIIHRDLKPANVLLFRRDSPASAKSTLAGGTHLDEFTPKIADFGLAKRLEDPAGPTKTGAVMGTPSYMAPEQARGRGEVGTLADVYALGAILYECLTGRPPFRAATTMDTLYQVLEHEPISPRRLNPAIDRDLETIALKCLQKDSRQRYASAAALADDLARYGEGRPIAARPIRTLARTWRWCRRNPVVASLVMLAMASMTLGTAASLYFAFDAAAQARRAEEEAEAASQSGERAKEKAEEARRKAEEAERSETRAKESAAAALAQKGIAQRNEARALRLLYGANIQGAQRLWEEGNITGLRSLLDSLLPSGPDLPDFRSFEWSYLRGLVQPNVPTLTGPWSEVVFSADGETFVGRNGVAVVVRETLTGRSLVALQLGQGSDNSVLSVNRRRLLCRESATTLRLWDVATGKPLPQALTHHDRVSAAAVGPDGSRVATMTWDGTLQLWDADTGKSIWRCPEQAINLTALAFSPDGTRLAVFAPVKDNARPGELPRPQVRVFDVKTQAAICRLYGHQGQARAVAFSPGGNRVATAGSDPFIKVWDVVSGQEIATLQAPAEGTNSLAFAHGEHRLVSGGGDGLVTLWDLDARQPLRRYRGHAGRVTAVAAPSTGPPRVVSYGADRDIRTWGVNGGPEVATLAEVVGAPGNLPFGPDDWLMAWGGDSPVVRDPAGKWIPLEGNYRDAGVSFSPDGHTLATSTVDGSILLWDLKGRAQIRRLRDPAGALSRPAFGPRGELLAVFHQGDRAASKPSGVRVFEVASGKERFSWSPADGQSGLRLAYGGDGSLAVSTWDGNRSTIVILDPSGTRPARRRGQSTGPSYEIAYHPAEPLLATAEADHSVRLWKLDSDEEPLVLRGHKDEVRGVAFSRDGERVATAGKDRTVKLWDIRTGQELLTLHGHRAAVERVAFHPLGRGLVSRGADGVRIWPVTAGLRTRTLLEGDGDPARLACSPDGITLAVFGLHHLRRLDLRSGRVVAAEDRREDQLGSLAWSPDGRSLALGTRQRGVALLDPSTFQVKASLGDAGTSIHSLAFSPDGKRLFARRSGNAIRAWNLETKESQLLYSVPGLSSLSPSPDGRRLATCNATQQVFIHDSETGKPLRRFEHAGAKLVGVAHSRDGRFLAACGADRDGDSGIVILWAVGADNRVRVLNTIELVSTLEFRPDGRLLASGHRDGTIQIWDPESGALWRTISPQRHSDRGSVRSLVFTPDGRILLSSDDAGAVQQWDLSAVGP